MRVLALCLLAALVLMSSVRAAVPNPCPTITLHDGQQKLYLENLPRAILRIEQVCVGCAHNKTFDWSFDFCNHNPIPLNGSQPCSPHGYVDEYHIKPPECATSFTKLTQWFIWNGSAVKAQYTNTADWTMNVSITCKQGAKNLTAAGPVRAHPVGSSKYHFEVELESVVACPVGVPMAEVEECSGYSCASGCITEKVQLSCLSNNSWPPSSTLHFCSGNGLNKQWFNGTADCHGIPDEAFTYPTDVCFPSASSAKSMKVLSCP